MPVSTEDPQLCPGCRTTHGPPGALCPACGSKYPTPAADPELAGKGAVAALIGVGLLLGAGLLGDGADGGARELIAGAVGLLGLALLVGGGITYAANSAKPGRVGPEQLRQTSCCGCSCAVALLVVPLTASMLWSQGGAPLALLAVPLWIPLSWALDAGGRVGNRLLRSAASDVSRERRLSSRRQRTPTHHADRRSP